MYISAEVRGLMLEKICLLARRRWLLDLYSKQPGVERHISLY